MTSRSSRSNGISNYQNSRPLNNFIIGDFKIGSKLGQGTFSKVCQGTHVPTGEKVAIKIMSKDQIKEKSDKIRIEKEINIQKKLHHQNIVQQYAIIETESTIYIISEYCSGGELFDYIVSKRKLYEVEACRIYQQLISGLEYLHKQRICHRDLKPENLLFDSKHNLKIADFGLSNDYHQGKLSTPCGSPCYAAPEMVTGKKYSGSSVDIWSSGIVLYTMVCGFLPFEDDNQNILFGKIAKGLFSLPSFLSQSCKDLLKKIMVTDPKKRYGFEEIKHHSWFMSVNNVMGKNIFFNSPGVFVGEDVIPIDVEIIAEIYNDFHTDIVKVINDVLRNRHNKITTTYYLILKRKIRNNEKSVSDISSNSTVFIKYIKNSISKMGYWNNDYDKIIEHYVKLVKKFLNSISEENSMSTDSRNKTNNNNDINKNGNANSTSNKENTNNLKTAETNIDKLNMKQITNNNNQKDYHVYTELNEGSINKKNTNNSNKFNNNIKSNNNNINSVLNHPLQNGGIDIRISTLYDEKNGIISTKPYMDTKNGINNKNLDKNDYEQDTEEPAAQKINVSYKPKRSIQEFLQTDTNNIKMNNKLKKESAELHQESKINKLNNNINPLKSEEESTNIDNKNYYEPKETTLPNADPILLTEINNIGINNLQNNLLNKNKNLKINNNNNCNKNISNDTNKNNMNNNNNNKITDNNIDYYRMNTLYNKDDDDEKLITIKNVNNINIIQTEDNINNMENTKRNSIPKKDNIYNEYPKSINNNNLSKAINGLSENNYNNNHNKNKLAEKISEDLNKINNSNITNKNYNNNKEKTNRFLLNIPLSNQIYKKITADTDKKDRIFKFMNQKNSSIPKIKEDSKKETTNYKIDFENGRFIYNNKNKYKYKNKYSQESSLAPNKHIHNISMNGISRANGSNEVNYMNKNYIINNDAPYIKKKKKPKSIDDHINRINSKYSKDLKIKESSKINDSFSKKDSKTSMNSNNEFYTKIINANKKTTYKDIINDKKYLDEPIMDSFRYKKKNNLLNTKINKKIEMPDYNNMSNISNKINNYNIDKGKTKYNYYMPFDKDANNYTNISTNKNYKLNAHNSFDLPKNRKSKLSKNYINNSIEKMYKHPNNNSTIITQYNHNYSKLNRKMKHYYRNASTKQNSAITQYYGMNNLNNYNMNNLEKFLNDKMQTNQRFNNKVYNKIKSNSLDMNTSKNAQNNNLNLNMKFKNKKTFYLNTSIIKDKTPKKSLFISLNSNNNNSFKNKNHILTTNENNLMSTNNNNSIYKNHIDEGRYLTFKENDNPAFGSTRKNQFYNYLNPPHKRSNFSQEPEKKRKESDILETFSTHGKVNSFILSNPKKFNNYLFNKDKNKNKFGYPNLKIISQFNKNIIYEKQHFITNSNNAEKNNGNNLNMMFSSKMPVDRIKEYTEKINGLRVNSISNKNSNKVLECNYKDGNNNASFILNIVKGGSGYKDSATIFPSFKKGNFNTYRMIVEQIKSKLI